ncbi:zinc finger protein 516-like isoform X2 [Engraulis encrasicolus]|uniref:zinc finger protein 516-like isoform X2 n=1 Tax=Engraulis encrasicolus TaxID=184585 RepID=UPI002FD69A58
MEVEGHLQSAVTNESPAKHTSSPAPAPHTCDTCGRTFPYLSALTKHALTHATAKDATKCVVGSKVPLDEITLEGGLGQTSMEIQEEQEDGGGGGGGRRGEEVVDAKKKEEEVKDVKVKEEEEGEGDKEGGVPEEQEGCSSPTESTSACNRVVDEGEKSDSAKSQRKGAAGRKERNTGSPCPLRQRKLRSNTQSEQERNAPPAPPEEALACHLCGFEASSKEELHSHEEKVHLSSDTLASREGSPENDAGAPDQGDLAQGGPLKTPHPSKKNQGGPLADHGCRLCGRRFREPWFLRSHMKTHTIRAKAKAGDATEGPATVNGVAQEDTALANDVCLYELCAKCGNFFQDRQSLWLHEQVHERVSGRSEAEKENEPLQNNNTSSSNGSNTNDTNKTPMSKKAFLECLNLRPASPEEKQPSEETVVVSRIPELDPISSYQAWQLATRGRVVEAHEHGLGWEERLADADVAYDREKGEYVLLKQEKRKKQQLVATTPSALTNTTAAGAVSKKKRTNNGAGEKNGHGGSSGDVSPESHSDSEYRPTAGSRRASQNQKTSECLECGKGFRSQQQMVIHMLIRHGGGSGFGAAMHESSAPIFGDATLSFLTNAAFKDQKLTGQTKDSDKKPSALKHTAGSSSSHQQGSASSQHSSSSSSSSQAGAQEAASSSKPDASGLLRHSCPLCTHSTLYPEVLWIHQRVAHKVNSGSTLAPKWALRNGFKSPRSSVEFRRRTGPPPFLEGKDCPALSESRKPRTQPPESSSSSSPTATAATGNGAKADRTTTTTTTSSSTSDSNSPSRHSRGVQPHKASSSSSSSNLASNHHHHHHPSSKAATSSSSSSSNASGGSRKRHAPSDSPSLSSTLSSSGNPKKPSLAPSPKGASSSSSSSSSLRASASSLLPQEGLHFVLASQHHHSQGHGQHGHSHEQGKGSASRSNTPSSSSTSTSSSSQRIGGESARGGGGGRDDGSHSLSSSQESSVPDASSSSSLLLQRRAALDALAGYPVASGEAVASQMDLLGLLKNCNPSELAALYHHWGLGNATAAMLDQAGVARSLFQQMKYVCPVCGKSFSQPSHYRTHMRSHTGERPFRCRYCPYSASQKGNLKTHVQTVHRVAFDNTSYSDGRLRPTTTTTQPEDTPSAPHTPSPTTLQDTPPPPPPQKEESTTPDPEGLFSEGLDH